MRRSFREISSSIPILNIEPQTTTPVCRLPYLPNVIIEKILQSVPILSLLRFRAVCRDWKNMIDERRFINATMKNGRKEQIFLHTKGYELWILDPGPPFKYTLFCEFEGQVLRKLSQCDGLVVFSSLHVLAPPDLPRRVAIVNCCLGEVRFIDREDLSIYDAYILGRDNEMRYKLLRFNIFGSHDLDYDYEGPEAELYDLNSDNWKPTPSSPEGWGVLGVRCVPISVGCCSFWLAILFSTQEIFLQSFDFSLEAFLPKSLPFALKQDASVSVAYFREGLSVVYQSGRPYKTEVWVSFNLEDTKLVWRKCSLLILNIRRFSVRYNSMKTRRFLS